MKTYKNALILLAVAVVLVGAYFGIRFLTKTDTTDNNNLTSTEKLMVIEPDRTKMAKVVVNNSNGEFIFEMKEDWVLTSPSDFKQYLFRASITPVDFVMIPATKLVEENASDFAQYGLDKPKGTVDITFKDGSVLSMSVGNKNPTGDGWYCKTNETDRVYLIDETNANYVFRISRLYLMDRTIFTEVPEEIFDLNLDRYSQPAFYLMRLSDSEWKLTKPFEVNMDNTQIENILIDTINVKIEEYVEENCTNFSKYGLDEPIYSLSVNTQNSGWITLHLGLEMEKDTKIYGYIEGNNNVFYINPRSLNYLDKPLKEVIETNLFMIEIAKVKNLTIEAGDKKISADIYIDPEDRAKDSFTINGKDGNVKNEKGESLFRKLYMSVITVGTGCEIEQGDGKYKDPEITITFNLIERNRQMKAELVRKDENYFYIFKNGEYANLILDASKMGNFHNALNDLISALG